MFNKFMLLISLSPAFLFAAELTKEDIRILYSGGWKVPAQLPPARIEKLLKEFTAKTNGKAFRYIGVEEDFFHGHLIFEKKGEGESSLLYPRAILYHTQESADKAHWALDVDKKYDYINVATRNWIQWLSDDETKDGKDIRNAREYLNTTIRDPKEFEVEFAVPQKGLFYTVHTHNLDPNKLGFKIFGDLSIEFYHCDPNSFNNISKSDDPIYLSLQGEEHCLTLTTYTGLREIK